MLTRHDYGLNNKEVLNMRRVGRSQHLDWLNDELRSSCSSSVFLLRFRSKYNPAWHALLSSSLKMASFLHFVAVDPAGSDLAE